MLLLPTLVWWTFPDISLAEAFCSSTEFVITIEDSFMLSITSDMSAITFTASSVFACTPSIRLAMSSAAWAL
jgi:hypothetical protein